MDRKQKKILGAIVEYVEESGVCPTLGWVVGATKINRNTARNHLQFLIRSGHLTQPTWHGAPYKPLMAEDGLRVVISVTKEHP